MANIVVCSVCGKHFAKAVSNLYKVTKKGKTLHQCSYTCWQRAKEMPYEDHHFLARMRPGSTFDAIHIKNNRDPTLKENTSFVVEFDGHRWFALTRFIGTIFYTYMNIDGKEQIYVRDSYYLDDNAKLKFVSSSQGYLSGTSRKIDDVLNHFQCFKLNSNN